MIVNTEEPAMEINSILATLRRKLFAESDYQAPAESGLEHKMWVEEQRQLAKQEAERKPIVLSAPEGRDR